MLVVLQHGSRVGQVVDLLPREAHALLADGRARPVDDDASAPVAPSPAASNRLAAPIVAPPAMGRRSRGRR